MRGRATWKGAKIGGIVGGAAGTIAGIAALSGCDDVVCAFAIPILGGEGVIAGGLIGAGFGNASTKWHRRYSSPDYDFYSYSNLSEAEYAAYWDGGVAYSNENLKAVHPNRLRFSIVPDIIRGGVNISASFAF